MKEHQEQKWVEMWEYCRMYNERWYIGRTVSEHLLEKIFILERNSV